MKLLTVSLLILFFFTIIAICICCCKRKRKRGLFCDTGDKIEIVKFQLVQMIGSDVYTWNVHDVLSCVEENMKRKKVKNTFSMDGDSMDEPIKKIYETNKPLYEILNECGFLRIIGQIVASAAWISSNGSDINRYLNCLDSIDWGDIKVWNNISEIISSCMES